MSYASIDSERMRAVREKISTGLRAAVPVVWRITKSAAALSLATALAATGGAITIFAFIQARQPDEGLLRAAIKAVRPVEPPSANDERDVFLVLLIMGVALAVIGFEAVSKWWKTTIK